MGWGCYISWGQLDIPCTTELETFIPVDGSLGMSRADVVADLLKLNRGRRILLLLIINDVLKIHQGQWHRG